MGHHSSNGKQKMKIPDIDMQVCLSTCDGKFTNLFFCEFTKFGLKHDFLFILTPKFKPKVKSELNKQTFFCTNIFVFTFLWHILQYASFRLYKSLIAKKSYLFFYDG